MSNHNFVHLHCHTQYSLLDGANKIDLLIERAKSLGQPAIAMTDHGNMFGAVDFYRKAVAAGIKPILGCEAYVAPGSRYERQGVDRGNREHNHHLILLAMNNEGYRNLCKLVTLGYTQGFYYKPRIDKELLQEHNTGIIALSGCLSGEMAKALTMGSMDQARIVAENYRAIFDDRYYLEAQDNKLPLQEKVNAGILELGKELSLPVVATNDCHYLDADDAQAHDILLCIQTGKGHNDPNRMKMETEELFVKSTDQMLAGFAHLPDAVDQSVAVAERCDVEIEFGKYHFPRYETPDSQSLDDYLDSSAHKGLDERLEGAGEVLHQGATGLLVVVDVVADPVTLVGELLEEHVVVVVHPHADGVQVDAAVAVLLDVSVDAVLIGLADVGHAVREQHHAVVTTVRNLISCCRVAHHEPRLGVRSATGLETVNGLLDDGATRR